MFRKIATALAFVCAVTLIAATPASAAPINDFEASFTASTDKYVKAVSDAQAELQSKTSDPTLLPPFADTFTRATGAGFTASVWQADGLLKSHLKSGLYPKDVAKNIFVNSINQAKDSYFNNIEGAKNLLADRCNQAGVGAPKDVFMAQLGNAMAVYSNELAQMVNQLMATL